MSNLGLDAAARASASLANMSFMLSLRDERGGHADDGGGGDAVRLELFVADDVPRSCQRHNKTSDSLSSSKVSHQGWKK